MAHDRREAVILFIVLMFALANGFRRGLLLIGLVIIGASGGVLMLLFFIFQMKNMLNYNPLDIQIIQPLFNVLIVVFIAGCCVLAWRGIILSVSRRSPRGAMIVSSVESRVSVSSLYRLLGSLIFILLVLFLFFPSFFFPVRDWRITTLILSIGIILGVYLIILGSCTKDLDRGKKRRASINDRWGVEPRKLEYVQKALLEDGSLMVDLEQVCKTSGSSIDQVLRVVYEMAGSGLIKGKLVRGHFFKIDGSIEEVILQIDKMFEIWSASDKSAKIVGNDGR